MDERGIYSMNEQVAVFFSVKLIDILSQVQTDNVDGDIDQFSGSNVYVIMNMKKTLKNNSHPIVNKGKTIEKMLDVRIIHN